MQRHLRSAIWSSFAFASLSIALSDTARAQSTIAGTWLMRYEHQSHNLHSTAPDPIEVVQGRLTLRQTGDSIFGEWQTMVAKGDTASPPPPRNVHGVQRRDSVFLRFMPIVDSDAGMFATAAQEIVVFLKTYLHGMPPTTTAFDVALRGDALTGTRRTVLLDGTPRGKEEALTGVRTKP